MIRSAPPRRSASKLTWKTGAAFRRMNISLRAFTLLEMCIVLFIIALLIGAMTPAMQSALAEQAVRNDSRQLEYMVRKAMLKSAEQHRPYVMDVTSSNLDLHPAETTDSSSPSDDGSAKASNDIEMTCNLDRFNKLLAPNLKNSKTWIAMPAASWRFQPGELCPVPCVRLARGQAWIEMSFNALTGNVENETAYFP